MEIKVLDHNDLPSIIDLQPEGWDIMQTIAFYTSANFCYPIKLTDANIIVGIGTTIIHHDVAWLAHIIVHPDYRNQGIGKLLTETLVERARSEYCDTIYLLATELGEPVYKKIGFQQETEYVSFKGGKINEQTIHSKNIIAYDNDLETQISIMDREVSGEDRKFHLEPHLSSGFVYVDGSEVMGYYLPTFGDGLIIATNDSAGQALMKLRLTTKDFVVFPKDNEHATAIMHQYNFTAF